MRNSKSTAGPILAPPLTPIPPLWPCVHPAWPAPPCSLSAAHHEVHPSRESESAKTMSSGIIDISDADDLDLPNNPNNSKSILFFWADWHAPSNTGGPFDTVVKALAAQNDGSVIFYRVLAEEAPMLSGKVWVHMLLCVMFDWSICLMCPSSIGHQFYCILRSTNNI